jgi:biopolymer transport protein TolR
MGASVNAAGSGGGTRRGRRGNRKGLNADINVTPLVDVMLVLLIVFMVAAPLMTVSVPVDLPKASAKPTPSPVEPTYITVQADKTVFLGEQRMPMEQLLAQLESSAKEGKNESLMVRADTALTYGNVMEVLGLLNGAGYTKVGLATLPTEKAPSN